MKKTRNLIILSGSATDTSSVLGTLQFKGLITNPYGITVTPALVTESFEKNKSVVCSADDYPAILPTDAIIINVMRSTGAKCTLNAPIILADLPEVATQFAQIADKLGLDIGDHKSNSSGLNGTPTIEDCVYCRYLAGDIGINERTVYKSKNFFVMPGVGQFINGYLIIMPFAHVMSNAELTPDVLTEFEDVLADVEEMLKLAYGCKSVLVWENGSGNSGIGKAKDSIVHSHVHIAPSNMDISEIGEISGFKFEKIVLNQLSQYKEHSYLLIRYPDKKHWGINNDPRLYIPRQFVRQVLAEECGISGDLWNWRIYPFRDKMHQTVVDLQRAITENWMTLSERIKENTRCLF